MSASPVSIHPYFQAKADGWASMQALLPRFVEKTQTEAGVLYYEFTQDEQSQTVHCREAYRDAAALLAHLENVGGLLEEMLTHAELVRVEVHGPAAELEQLRTPMQSLPVAWYTRVAGITG